MNTEKEELLAVLRDLEDAYNAISIAYGKCREVVLRQVEKMEESESERDKDLCEMDVYYSRRF